MIQSIPILAALVALAVLLSGCSHTCVRPPLDDFGLCNLPQCPPPCAARGDQAEIDQLLARAISAL